MTDLNTPLQAYLASPVGEQMRVHLDHRAAVRRAVPLLPRRWAELLALWRRPAASSPIAADRRPAGRGDRLASQSK